MPQFTLNTPIATSSATIQVDGAGPGTHQYQLVVEDEAGNRSQPTVTTVVIARPQPRTQVIQVGPLPVALASPSNTDEVWVVCAGQIEGPRGAVFAANISSGAVTSRIVVGVSPAEIAISPRVVGGRRIALVTNNGDNTTTAIDVEQHSVLATIQTGPRPLGVDISPNGRFGYVVNNGVPVGAGLIGSLTVIDMTTLQVLTNTQLVFAPERVVFVPSGKQAYINNSGAGTVAVIDVSTHKVVATVKVGGVPTSAPRQVSVAAETFPLWTANQRASNASRIAEDFSVEDIDLGMPPEAVVSSTKGDLAVLAGSASATIAVLDSRSGTLSRRSIPLLGEAGKAGSIALSASGGSLMVAHPNQHQVSVLDTAFFNTLLTLPVPKTPVRCALAVNGKFGCVACRNGQSVFVMEMAVFP